MQAYSEPFVSLVYFENLAYSEQLYIQKPEIFRTCQTSTMERFANIVNYYSDFHNTSFSRSILCENCEKICIF